MSARSNSPNSEQGGARPLGDDNPIVVAGNFVTDCCDDALMAGAASIADIDRLMDEVQRARDFLQSEGERLRKMNASYANLAQTTSASAKIIAESLGKWRDNQGNGSRAAMPHAHGLSLTPDQDVERLSILIAPSSSYPQPTTSSRSLKSTIAYLALPM